ncbi:MAG TPA: hypothetical protein PK156_23135 [Polyangium sp.]|nr:hypothetical protein [Polyangium sp.]
MASLDQVPRDEKRRIASEIHDNLEGRASTGAPDAILDPFIAKSAAVHRALATPVEDKNAAIAERAAFLAESDVNDDEVDRWYRHIYRYLEVEALRRHGPAEAAVDALLDNAYADGLDHIDARIPEQNEQVRKTLTALRHPEVASTLQAIQLPREWLDYLESAASRSDASFAAYQAAIGDQSSAVAMGRGAEDEWVLWARALTHAIALRSTGASLEVVEEGKRLIAPLTNAIRKLRSDARARATRKKESPAP